MHLQQKKKKLQHRLHVTRRFELCYMIPNRCRTSNHNLLGLTDRVAVFYMFSSVHESYSFHNISLQRSGYSFHRWHFTKQLFIELQSHGKIGRGRNQSSTEGESGLRIHFILFPARIIADEFLNDIACDVEGKLKCLY